MSPRSCRISIERNNMDNEVTHAINNNLSRLADAIEEILRLVKKDMEDVKKRSK